MNQVNCPICGNKCIKVGETEAGSQRWFCKICKLSITHKIDKTDAMLRDLQEILRIGKEQKRLWEVYEKNKKIDILSNYT